MKVFKRLGAVPERYQFSLQLDALEFSRPLPSEVMTQEQDSLTFIWKRGPRSVQAKHITVHRDKQDRRFAWEQQEYSLMCTLYKEGDKYQDKEATIKVRIGDKDLGIAHMNISKYATAIKEPIEDLLFLEKCKDKAATIKITVRAKYIKELDPE
jgi:hypothetical protein